MYVVVGCTWQHAQQLGMFFIHHHHRMVHKLGLACSSFIIIIMVIIWSTKGIRKKKSARDVASKCFVYKQA